MPVLRSERLLLRRHEEGDLDAAAAMWADPEVVRHIGGRPFTREEVWHRLLRYIGHWALRPYGYWVVADREDGRFLGEIGLADWKRQGMEELRGAPESGWALVPEAHGRGLGREALATVLDWADAELGVATVCMIGEANAASIRLAAQMGYVEASRRSHEGGATIFFRRPRGTGSAPAPAGAR